MDLARELKDVRFELALRGYDCEAVDAFLAKLGGDITGLQEANEASAERIRELENAVQEGGGSAETEGTLRRTLVLAQRLADETEAEAKRAAADLIDGATAEAEQMRSSAEAEAQSMREEGKRELDNARAEAAGIRETVAEELARSRAEARVSSEKILTESERSGMERVAALEQAAQVEVAKMREPIRAEVSELEGARARIMGDIAALERHLAEQRVRVRTAIEALRVGMSGSIEDLERVADDDELLATQPAPEISGASAEDVAVAPDIEIVEGVTANAPAAPTADEVEDTVAAALTVEEAIVEPMVDHVDVDEEVPDVDVVVDAEVIDEGPATEPIPLIDIESDHDSSSGEVVDPEDVPLAIEEDADPDFDSSELVELDQEPTALFGTDLGAEVDAVEVGDVTEEQAASAAPGVGFVDRFAELLDSQPVGRDQ